MTTTVHTHISNGGRVVIPAEYRKKLGLEEGEQVTVSLDEFGIRISTPRLALRQLQALARQRVARGRSLSGELIAERREQAKKE